MINKKIGVIASIVVISLVLLGLQYNNKHSNNTPAVAPMIEENGNPESLQVKKIPIKSQGEQIVKTNTMPAETNRQKDVVSKSKHIQWDKKQIDEQWCSAKYQLNKTDYQFTQTQQQDWDILLGKARTRGLNNSEFYEQWTPNNQYIEAYESLQIEELRSLAYEGDKWAMVAFVQHVKAPPKMQSEISKRLMVQGASYYGLEYLVIDALSTAKTKLDKADTASAINQIIEAAVYAYWGLEYYNDGGLQPFIAITNREPFLTQFPIGPVLKKSENEINQRLAELKAQIAQQRSADNIEVPELPPIVRKNFANSIAMRELSGKEQFKLLRSLNIGNNELVKNAPCVAKIIADFEAKTQ